MSQITAIHICGKVGRQSYGLGSVAVHLAKAQAAQGSHSSVWCVDSREEVEWAARHYNASDVPIRSFKTLFSGIGWYSPAMEREVPPTGSHIDRPSAIHQHSIWTGLSRVTSKWHSLHRVPTVVAAHGALQPWALRKSSWKKTLASRVYEAENLKSASCLHACGENEISDYRGYSLRNPIALLPNAVSEEWLSSSGDPALFRARHRITADVRIMLYLSRITPKKGLPLLLDAMHALKAELKSWVLLIAGADEFGHQQQLEAQIQRQHLDGFVKFIGPLFGQEKRDAFAAAELFVLPTHSEGSPLAVLEALGAGVPVLTTKGTPWADLVTYRCGWWTDVSAEAIHRALAAALATSQSDLRIAGQRGYALVSSNYTWRETASKTIQLYRWLNGEGDLPAFVHLF